MKQWLRERERDTGGLDCEEWCHLNSDVTHQHPPGTWRSQFPRRRFFPTAFLEVASVCVHVPWIVVTCCERVWGRAIRLAQWAQVPCVSWVMEFHTANIAIPPYDFKTCCGTWFHEHSTTALTQTRIWHRCRLFKRLAVNAGRDRSVIQEVGKPARCFI